MFRGLLCVVIPMLNLSTGVLKINGFGPNEHLVGDCFRKLYEPGDAYW